MKIAIIGGSGLEKLDIFKNSAEHIVETVYGKPSSALIEGSILDVPVVFLSRHGNEHTITPTHVNNRANIQALKQIGCTHIIVTTACGSLREEIGRGDLVILDQFIDFTRFRNNTFHDSFKPQNPIHTAMAEAFSEELRRQIIKAADELKLKYHSRGTVVTIEGPRFSTRAESNMFRQWGADVINMSTAPECMLANEAGMPYAAIALSTDYDCWKTDEDPVSWEAVLAVFRKNVENVTRLLVKIIENFKVIC
ncbi:MAG: S-methyl-5'-thioadenosine phosphorylase [Bacteroidales bacterium]|jgi:5'-methylthioadenosine phosphorylase|nr:S-methyl-5'-thioadenosine phosphorylase [Bacteroidales bacterium]MDD4214295.1 S-methyl-5'-thioadenosine phosphorylase [Bacteroidales bacterium]